MKKAIKFKEEKVVSVEEQTRRNVAYIRKRLSGNPGKNGPGLWAIVTSPGYFQGVVDPALFFAFKKLTGFMIDKGTKLPLDVYVKHRASWSVDLPGMVDMGRPYTYVRAGGLRLGTPCEDVGSVISGLQNAKRRYPESCFRPEAMKGKVWYELQFFNRSLMITDKTRKLLLAAFTRAEKRARNRMEAFDRKRIRRDKARQKKANVTMSEVSAPMPTLPDDVLRRMAGGQHGQLN